MRHSTLPMSLIAALALSACTGPTPIQQHWGESQRNASQAMIDAAKRDPKQGIDGRGAQAAYDNYSKALEQSGKDAAPEPMFHILEGD